MSLKFWSLGDLEKYFDRSKASVWVLRKEAAFPAAIEIQGRLMFDAQAIMNWDRDRKKAADARVKLSRAQALAEIKAVSK